MSDRSVFRVILPVVAAAVLLFVGGLFLRLTGSRGIQESMILSWPVLLLAFLGLWLLFRRYHRWVSPTVFLFASAPVLVLLMAFQVFLPNLPTSASAGKEKVVDLSAKLLTLDGKPVTVENYSGKVLFINFWATWCSPCRAEMPSMADLYLKFQNEGLSMVAITNEDPETVQAYLEERPYPFPILLDPEGTLFRRLEVYGLPTTYVLDGQNNVILNQIGGNDWDSPDMVDRFRSFLAE
ncbi:MAG: TlpA disulfide reductase family protein [Acidobacteriota bacterium]